MRENNQVGPPKTPIFGHPITNDHQAPSNSHSIRAQYFYGYIKWLQCRRLDSSAFVWISAIFVQEFTPRGELRPKAKDMKLSTHHLFILYHLTKATTTPFKIKFTKPHTQAPHTRRTTHHELISD